jgi:hypothetical protein
MGNSKPPRVRGEMALARGLNFFYRYDDRDPVVVSCPPDFMISRPTMFKRRLPHLFLPAALAIAPFAAFAQAQATASLAPEQSMPDGEPEPVLARDAGQGMPLAGVKKITDGSLSCGQIHAEVQGLEKSLAGQQAGAAAAQQVADDARNAMMSQSMERGGGMQRGMGMASSLLGMIPGVGMVAGMAGSMGAQADMSARMAGIQDNTNKMMAAQQKAMELQQAMASAQARHEHLIDLFLRKNCSLPQR